MNFGALNKKMIFLKFKPKLNTKGIFIFALANRPKVAMRPMLAAAWPAWLTQPASDWVYP
jgi:hypothetical protein